MEAAGVMSHFCHILLDKVGHRARQIQCRGSKYKYEYGKVWFSGPSLVNGSNMLIPFAKDRKTREGTSLREAELLS